ncbi:cupin domain-containing protein [Oceanobacillus jeddahense]|uniref:Cupin domain-containing protein n=1 Tax=Oceanobacillus jeddahense TaxID=1462527 RepID=A0ABY5JLD4_9BACI|nr:cupin domain-containing protein [Oceanobacillus jeddahense]UUI01116.1 cupin domain-containing protein [Oceanobacillus jeddahense]
MEIKKESFLKSGLINLFQEKTGEVDFKFGTVTIPPGERIPKEGFSIHEENEYAVIIEGEVEGESGGKAFCTPENDATFIPAGEAHWVENTGNKSCKVVWVLIKS